MVRVTFYAQAKCIELEVVEGFDEDDSFDAGAAVIELFFGLDVDPEGFIFCVGVSHYYNESNKLLGSNSASIENNKKINNKLKLLTFINYHHPSFAFILYFPL